MSRNLTLISLLFLGLLGCLPVNKQEKDKSKIWLDVYSRYLEADQAYKVELTFLKGDTLPAAKSFQLEGDVFFDQGKLNYQNLSAGFNRYQLDYNDIYNERIPINIRDEKINWKDFELNFPKVPSFELQNGEESRISFPSAIDLQPLEELTAIISDENRQSTSIEIQGPKAVTSIPLGPKVYQELSPGNWDIYLVYKRKGALYQDDKTTNYLLEYYSSSQQLLIGGEALQD